MRRLEGHSAAVDSLSFSPDGLRLASAGKDGTLRVWYLGMNRPATVLEGDFCAAVFDASDNRLAGGTTTGSVAVWNHSNACKSLPGQERVSVAALTFCYRGKYLLVGFGDRVNSATPGFLHVIDVEKNKRLRSFGATNGVWAIASEPNGKRVLWGGGDKRVTRRDLTAQDQLTTPRHNRDVRAIALSPDGKVFAVSDDYSIRIYNTEAMQEQRQLAGHKGRVDALAFAPDGRLFSGAWDRLVKIWDADTGREEASYDWELGNVRTVSCSPDGLTAAAAGDRGVIVVWDLEG